MSLLETATYRAGEAAAVESRLREEIKEIARAYRHSWDIYSELIQNSVDAINRRYRILNDPDFYLYERYHSESYQLTPDTAYVGKLKLNIDMQRKEISIRDNGTGIPGDKMEEFLLPKGGDKTVSQEYGFKGYGLTFAAFISTEFEISSRFFAALEPSTYRLSLHGLFDWLTNSSDTITFPSGPLADTTKVPDDLDDWNTIITVKLAEDYTSKFPAISAADQAITLATCGKVLGASVSKPEGFEYILRSRTAIGNTRSLFSSRPKVPIEVSLTIVTSEGERLDNIEIPFQYYHPKDHSEVSIDLYDFADYYERYKRAGTRKEFRGLYHTIMEVEAGLRRVVKFDVALAAISSTRLSNIQSSLGLDEIETMDANVSYGVHLAIDGMPTGLRIDDWDMKGHYLKRYFVVVDANLDISGQLDPGRKGISGHYARLISDKVLELMNSTIDDSDPFARYAANHLNYGRGREEGGLPPQEFPQEVIQAKTDVEKDKESDKALYSILRNVSSLKHFPRDEQEVIVLFYELVTGGYIKGYQTLYLSGGTAYDAAFEYEIECNEDNIYPKDNLGIGKVLVNNLTSQGLVRYVHRVHYSGMTTYPELCVDFKLNAGRFLDEIKKSSTSKDPNILSLLISWDTSIPTSILSTSYTLDDVWDNQRIYHSTTHRLGLRGHHNTEVFCISLKHVLQKIGETSSFVSS